MNARQQLFVTEYLVDLNATQAAIRAGYAPKHADVTGPRLLGNAGIQAALKIGLSKRSARIEVTADRVLAELAKIGFSDVRKLFDADGKLKSITGLSDDAAAAIQSVEVNDGPLGVTVTKVRLWDKKGSLELIGRHLGMFEQTINLKGKLDTAPQVNVGALTDEQLRTLRATIAPALALSAAKSGPEPAGS